MQKFVKGVGKVLLLLVVAVAGLITYVVVALPKVKAAATIKVEPSKARLARGEYLVKHVAVCMDCHSQRDYSFYGGPIKPGTEFGGGDVVFDRRIGLPGKFLPKNITPFGLARYTDGELERVLRTGVTKEGNALFPMMPYQNFATLSQEDIYSIIAYVRSLPENKNVVPEHELDGPMKVIIHTIPKEAPAYAASPSPKDSVAYGKYLVTMASCAACHTPVDDHHQPLPGMDFAGGWKIPYLNFTGDMMPMKGGYISPANITPDKETGIGSWTKAQFIARFADWRAKKGQARVVKISAGEAQTIMPWIYYCDMTDTDLGAIYDYLHSLPAVKNEVKRFQPPTI